MRISIIKNGKKQSEKFHIPNCKKLKKKKNIILQLIQDLKNFRTRLLSSQWYKGKIIIFLLVRCYMENLTIHGNKFNIK